MSDLADLTIAEAGRRLRRGEITSEDLTDATLTRAAVTETHLHAYLTLNQDAARAASRTADEAFAADDLTSRGPCDGDVRFHRFPTR